MDNIKSSTYKVEKSVKLSDLTTLENFGTDDKDLKKTLGKVRRKLGNFQNMLYFKDFNASGVEVHSFKVPTELELKHDYLWRHYIVLPAKGIFGVFNRTHYENVLVTRVHPEYIMSEQLPGIHSVDDIDQSFWDKRFEQINNFEKHIAQHGTLVFKFFLNLSKDEQRRRLLRRLELREKNWKFSPGDLKERKLWDSYQKCYEEAINKTSTQEAPWYIIPADNKKGARLIFASILLEELSKYTDIKEPELEAKVKANLEDYKNQLQNE